MSSSENKQKTYDIFNVRIYPHEQPKVTEFLGNNHIDFHGFWEMLTGEKGVCFARIRCDASDIRKLKQYLNKKLSDYIIYPPYTSN